MQLVAAAGEAANCLANPRVEMVYSPSVVSRLGDYYLESFGDYETYHWNDSEESRLEAERLVNILKCGGAQPQEFTTRSRSTE